MYIVDDETDKESIEQLAREFPTLVQNSQYFNQLKLPEIKREFATAYKSIKVDHEKLFFRIKHMKMRINPYPNILTKYGLTPHIMSERCMPIYTFLRSTVVGTYVNMLSEKAKFYIHNFNITQPPAELFDLLNNSNNNGNVSYEVVVYYYYYQINVL